MTQNDAIQLYQLLTQRGIRVWVDGGFCVDALIGQATRAHSDLDIAVTREDVLALRETLSQSGFTEVARPDSTAWMFVLSDGMRQVDVHVFAYDDASQNIYGVEYPYGSLTGMGYLGDVPVNCVAPQWMFQFKTAYAPAQKDLADVHLLAEKFGFSIPNSHQIATNKN